MGRKVRAFKYNHLWTSREGIEGDRRHVNLGLESLRPSGHRGQKMQSITAPVITTSILAEIVHTTTNSETKYMKLSQSNLLQHPCDNAGVNYDDLFHHQNVYGTDEALKGSKLGNNYRFPLVVLQSRLDENSRLNENPTGILEGRGGEPLPRRSNTSTPGIGAVSLMARLRGNGNHIALLGSGVYDIAHNLSPFPGVMGL